MPKNRYGETISYVGKDGRIPYGDLGVQDDIVAVEVKEITVRTSPEKTLELFDAELGVKVPATVAATVFVDDSPVEKNILNTFNYKPEVFISYLTGVLLTQSAVDKIVNRMNDENLSETERENLRNQYSHVYQLDGHLRCGVKVDCVGPSRIITLKK